MSSPGADEAASPRKKKQRPDGVQVVQEVDEAKNMQRYLVTVEYIGSRYLGFQKQKGQDCKTVQGALEEAFCKFVGKPVESAPSSRTDTGVHALRNVCHVDVERVSKRKPGEIRDGEDVQVVDVKCVPRDFHARFEAKERTYHYRIIVSTEALSIFERNRAWYIHEDLHIPLMQQACRYLEGHHDFSSFRAAGCQAKSPVKTLDELHVCEMRSWLCYPSERQRTQCVNESFQIINGKRVCPTDVEVESADDCPKSPSNPIINLNMAVVEQTTVKSKEKERGPHCYVITARARSFLYHQAGAFEKVASWPLSKDKENKRAFCDSLLQGAILERLHTFHPQLQQFAKQLERTSVDLAFVHPSRQEVRLMVGLLKAVGTGEVQISEVPHILEARTVTKAPPMAPACGLYLANVKYELDR